MVKTPAGLKFSPKDERGMDDAVDGGCDDPGKPRGATDEEPTVPYPTVPPMLNEDSDPVVDPGLDTDVAWPIRIETWGDGWMFTVPYLLYESNEWWDRDRDAFSDDNVDIWYIWEDNI